MISNESLNVWYEDTLVGELWEDHTNAIGFCYDSGWQQNGFPISQQLPLSSKTYLPEEGKAHLFFANLLPEAGARNHIVRDLKIADNDFALLSAIGGECAGALSILPMDYTKDKTPSYHLLQRDTLKQMLLRKSLALATTKEKERPRLSLAGAQDKCPIFYDGKDYFLPQDAAPSSHIIKFEVTGYSHIPAYEYFFAQLARAVNLPTVDCSLQQYEDTYFLLVKRYDRIASSNKNIKRLHQEDFCQALGVAYSKKYQQHGGPSFCDCYQLLQSVSTNPIVDTENLLKWQIFNVLAGNSDGHAKNLALLYESHQTRLAPFYDLVCTRAIERIDTRLALSVGGVFHPGDITIAHWEQLAKNCDIHPSYMKKQLKDMAENLLDAYDSVESQFKAEYGPYPALQRIKKIVLKQCKRMLR